MASYDPLILLYLGSVGSIFILNAVQWGLSRDWVYGLFTLQALIWLAYVITFGFDQTDSQRQVVYAVTMGIVRISYVALLNRLFTSTLLAPRLQLWLQWTQRILAAFMLLEVVVFFVHPDLYTHPVYQAIFDGYLIFVLVSVGIGIWVAAHDHQASGRFFLLGSTFRFIDELRALFFFVAIQLHVVPFDLTSETTRLISNLMGALFIFELLSFSLCLVFRQRQSAVAQAVGQARLEDQLVQERLEAELTLRRLEQEKTDVQLRALQAQVNPHFLFNSLNSLSTLIDEGPDRASQFVDQLSQVYRYLLRANDQPLTMLASELDFIDSYFYLLKTRHGDGLALTVQVNPDYTAHLLPPLTLQLLVENAVKHNVTMVRKPLQIDIFTDETGQLTIQNNLQRKRTLVLSNGVGLSTILTQYQMLGQPTPIIDENEDMFRVTLHLIEPLT